MSRDLLGEFGDFSSAAPPTSNNTFSQFSSAPSHSSSQNFDDLLGLFDSKAANNSTTNPQSPPAAAPSFQSSTSQASPFTNQYNAQPQYHSDFFSSALQPPRPPLQAASSEAIIAGLVSSKPATPQTSSTTLFSTSPQHHAVFDADADDDFGEFAEEPLPSFNPSFGPFTDSSPSEPQKSKALSPTPQVSISQEDDFGQFIYTPRVPTPPPQQPAFSLSSTITNPNHSHPPNPPPPLHRLLPVLTTQLLSPLPFLTRLKPLSYPAKQRLLSAASSQPLSSPSSSDTRVKDFFTSVILTTHVAGRLIASKRIRARRPYKSKPGAATVLATSKSDVMKDDREVSECVREYGDIVGSLRAVVRSMGLVVPELSVDMQVQSFTPSSSSRSSPALGGKGGRKGNNVTPASIAKDEFCWLCGLGATDKVNKLKEDGGDGITAALENGKDINGKERWVAGWGHRSCKNWWEGFGAREVKNV
ncbi:hypothetical protein ABW20_dc0102280 [Dactylellina cionopaga]|nr:hypothetical protein ABW20_dc0102280 [Dactylellina cionopaga]